MRNSISFEIHFQLHRIRSRNAKPSSARQFYKMNIFFDSREVSNFAKWAIIHYSSNFAISKTLKEKEKKKNAICVYVYVFNDLKLPEKRSIHQSHNGECFGRAFVSWIPILVRSKMWFDLPTNYTDILPSDDEIHAAASCDSFFFFFLICFPERRRYASPSHLRRLLCLCYKLQRMEQFKCTTSGKINENGVVYWRAQSREN